nr:hypothetical protein [Tanacetum cinerariifolium]
DVNVTAPADQAPTMAPPIRTDDQILPHIRWMPIGKATAIWKAFTASSTIPSIYIQQFWDTVRYDKTVGCYTCQLDEQWFDVTKGTLRDALQITTTSKHLLPLHRLIALTTIINLCLTGKTSGFERPRAPVLQILWGVINRAHLDYVESIWEEFTQSIHTFIEDKRNLPQHTHGKKKATLIVIPSIRFTKLIIYHLQRKHKFHPRHDSPLHLPKEEPVLGYLKFSAKGTKRERKHRFHPRPDSPHHLSNEEPVLGYLKFGAKGGVQNPPAPKPTQPARKPKAPTRPSISIPVASIQPAPTSAPAKSQENKRKQATETTDKPAKAKRIKRSISRKTRQPRSSPKSMGASKAEEGPLPPVVIREPESGKYQPLLEVPGKGKAKSDNEEESEKVVLRAKEGGQDKGQAGPDPDAQPEDQTGSDAGAQAEGQAGSNPDETSEGQAGSNPDETSEGQAGSNPDETLKGQARPDPDEGFTATVYPNVQENLKLTVEEPVLPESPKEHQQLKATTTDTTTTTLPPPQAPQQSTTEAMMMKRIGELEYIMAGLIQVNKDMEERLDSHGSRLYILEQLDIPQWVSIAADMKEILHQRMWESDSYKSHEDHMQLFEALEKSMNRDHSKELTQDLAEARKKRKKSREPSKTPPGPSISLTLADLEMDEDMAPDEQVQSSDDEDIESAHIPTVNLRQGWWKPFEEERPITSKPAWSIHSSDVPVLTNNWASALASNYSPPLEDSLLVQTGDIATFMDCADNPILRHNVSKPLPLGGPPGQVTIQSDFFFNKDLEYLRYGSKGRRPALSISKMKAAYYPNAGLEKMVPYQFWIEEECKYDITAMYDISHWWFQRHRFYINRHTFEGDRSAVRTHMRILSVVRIKDFYVNLTKPQWTATGFEYKHDYTVIESSRAVMFQDKYEVQMMMHVNEIHKFSDGTLQQIDEALDYRVKEFRINRLNPGLNTRFWTRKDVDRCNVFMFAIQRRLRTRMIFCNLESFVGGSIREGDYRLLRCTD